MAHDANQRQLLGSIERDALLRCVERPLGAPHMRSPPSRGGPRLLYTHRTPSRRVPLARRPPAAAAASPPLTRACLISAYSDVHSGRPLERAPRLARAHRAALARPSAAQAPSRVPLGRCIAIDVPPCGARCKPEAAARARRSTRPRRETSRRAVHTGHLCEVCRGRGGYLLRLHAQIDQRSSRQSLGLTCFALAAAGSLVSRCAPPLPSRKQSYQGEQSRIASISRP